jgi:hypothetical protein
MTRSTTSGTVAQVSFPGQAACPDGPSDLLPMYLMHYGFRRDLTQFAAAAAETPIGDRPAWQRLAKRWELFSLVLHGHHTGEDEVLWPLLLSRVADAKDDHARQTLDAMEAEHGEIDPLLASCADGFRRLAETADPDARAALVVRLAATAQRLGEHLGHEETDAMQLVQRYLSVEDWNGMHSQMGKHYKSPVAFTLCWVMHQVPADLRPRVQAFIGTGGTLVARLLRPGFERRERRTFGKAGRLSPA